MGIIMYSGLILPRNLKSSIKVWQTSQFHGDRHTLLDAAELMKRGFEVDSMSFSIKKDCHQLPSTECTDEEVSKMQVDSGKHYQTVLGFGGAFTEAAANTWSKLPETVRDKVIQSYFGVNGIGYTLGRVHINSCDFSIDSYSFDDVSKDYDLKFFDMQVTHDQAEMIPMMRAAIRVSQNPIRLLASPWSPPAWLKLPDKDGRHSMTGSAYPYCLKHTYKARSTWAKYISLFIEAYKAQGIPIWAVTPQNEPEFPAPWEACAYNTSGMDQFLGDHLGPTLDKDHPEVLILGFDHNKDHLVHWTTDLMAGHSAKYLDGMAFHWYAGSNDRLMDGTFGYDAVNATHHMIPDKLLVGSEGCSCPGVKINDWLRAERLGHDILFDLNNWANGWIDWNLMVDPIGGPNHEKNNCDANIVAFPGFTDVLYQPSFFYMGHISKFVPPGSKRINTKIVGNFAYANVDPGVRAGIELGLFDCEGSTRQLWFIDINKNNTLKMIHKSQDTEQTDGLLVALCAAEGDDNRGVLRLVACEYKGQPDSISLDIETITDGEMQLRDTVSGKCIEIMNNVREPGALLKLGTCDESISSQIWSFNQSTGEIKSSSSGLCLTSGWPFLTGAGFIDKSSQTVLIVMNEAPVDTPLVIEDPLHGVFYSGINARSIQTIVYEN
eukprot:CAMPEP_0182421362 /NCGR_PEP_ID=MMETSP1167-20130531/6724_1 /TAXON_ID=2988 /ORGANISM="Mallomonas Sp, Strain CCMP3275" /LENGTH=661 /DNA_ID=CAMNT_0024598421 /DNA_START=178 /DNA_END=2163 /DNA_ORIENTATION=-